MQSGMLVFELASTEIDNPTIEDVGSGSTYVSQEYIPPNGSTPD